MTDLVTVVGGAGFVGTRLCRLMEEREIPYVIVDKCMSRTFPDKCRIADVRDLDSLRRVLPGHGVIVNLAAEHRDDVRPISLYHDVNVRGAENICRVAAERGIDRIVFTSSVACYGHAEVGAGEDCKINPFNEYGRTKYLAEEVFRAWQSELPTRGVFIVRPTVIFGEQNRGNVYNLLSQIYRRRFVMIGKGRNVKSMAYVGNVAAFILHAAQFGCGFRICNYVDEPALDMNTLVVSAKKAMGQSGTIRFRLPYWIGYAAGCGADLLGRLTSRRFPISAIRVKKFASSSHFTSSAGRLGFVPPHPMQDALGRTIRYEFMGDADSDITFVTE